jgi:hypothetical protein
MVLTNEELRAKSAATRLKNLLAKAAKGKLTEYDESELRKLQAKATAKENSALRVA